jgi:hypothetical protein
MQAGRASRAGRITGLQAMFSELRFERGTGFAEKSERAKLLFDALSLTTFRVFDVRPPGTGTLEAAPPRFPYRFRQRGTGESLTLEFERDVFGLWRIAVPDTETLEASLGRLLAAWGMRELNPTGYRALASPRDTMKAFAVGMERWDLDGEALVRSTFDLSAVSERLRDWRLPILAAFMARNLNRIGELTLEEFPDDPESREP